MSASETDEFQTNQSHQLSTSSQPKKTNLEVLIKSEEKQVFNVHSQSDEFSGNTQNPFLPGSHTSDLNSKKEIDKISFEGLTFESTLKDLSLYTFQVELSSLGEEVNQAFAQNLLLPGAILTDQGKFVGIISRRQFFKVISTPYGKELFLSSPLKRLYLYVQAQVLICPSNMSIMTAAAQCLQRPPELLTEPLAVELSSEVYRLLDVHQLMVAQAHIHELATQLITEQAEQLERVNQAFLDELEKGRQIQRDFLPNETPQLLNWQVTTYFHPARQVAGDFYDAFMLPCGNLGLVIADVCDKGVGAALFMALFRSLIRIFSGQTCLGGFSVGNDTKLDDLLDSQVITDLDHLQALKAVALTNNYIAQQHCEMAMFATLFFGVLNPETGCLTYINGGHEPLLIVNSDGVKGSLEPTGPAVGMLPNMKFKVQQVQLEPGDILIGYTDGVTEARNPGREFFTTERLLSLIQKPFSCADDLVEHIKADLFTHIDNAQQSDDITMLVVQRLPCC